MVRMSAEISFYVKLQVIWEFYNNASLKIKPH
jgi:hypothetical protein